MLNKFKKIYVILLTFIFFLSYEIFCKQGQNTIMIFAPASLKDSLSEILKYYENYKHLEVKDVYLGTAQLAQQIRNGAKPDLFISANIEWMEHLEARGLVLKSYRFVLLGNSLVAVTSNENFLTKKKAYFKNIKNTFLNTGTRISLAMVEAVPAGVYAKEFFINIGIWDKISSNIANSPNVRAALSFISRGDLEYGVVYKSDALADKRVKIIYDLDPVLYSKVQYPMTILNEKQQTIDLYNFLREKKAQKIFKRWGFITYND